MPYNGVRIRQLMGGRKYIRIAYWADGTSAGETFGWNFRGKINPNLKYKGETREMENGDMKWKRDGVRFDGSVELYSLKVGDEEDIMELNLKLENHGAGVGKLWIYPHYDDAFAATNDISQNKYEIYESGDRVPAYLHEFLPDAQVFTYQFTGVKIVSGILKRVTLEEHILPGIGNASGAIPGTIIW